MWFPPEKCSSLQMYIEVPQKLQACSCQGQTEEIPKHQTSTCWVPGKSCSPKVSPIPSILHIPAHTTNYNPRCLKPTATTSKIPIPVPFLQAPLDKPNRSKLYPIPLYCISWITTLLASLKACCCPG